MVSRKDRTSKALAFSNINDSGGGASLVLICVIEITLFLLMYVCPVKSCHPPLPFNGLLLCRFQGRSRRF